MREHREALLRALLTRVESEGDLAAADTMASKAERAAARVCVGQLADLIQRVEEGVV